MAYTSFESVASGLIKDETAFSQSYGNATHVELQAVTNHVSYTMDGTTVPTDVAGMQLLTTDAPKTFLLEDFKNIKFIQITGAGLLNAHFFAGRDV